MREMNDLHSSPFPDAGGRDAVRDVADRMPIDKQVESITSKTLPSSAYSKAARAQLIRLGAAELCAQPEEVTE